MDNALSCKNLRFRTLLWPCALVAAMALATVPAHTAAATSTEVPVYRTTLPPPLTLTYRLRKGGWTGNGDLTWQPRGKGYQARLEGRVMGIKVMTWVSTGAIDAAGIAPARFNDERRGKSPWSANFQRPAGPIVYANKPDQHALVPGAQDRLSWMVQVAGVASADPQRVAKGERVSFFVSGARGDADVWSFQSKGPETVTTPAGSVSAVKLLREPRKPNDTRVEVWLDPARHHLPIRARLTNVQENDTLELLLEEMQPSS
jgi:hypothetical protein